MKIDAALVARVADLAALELHGSDAEALAGQLTRIVEHFEALRGVPDEILEGSVDAPAVPFRGDEPVARGLEAVVRANAPQVAHGHFVVPRVVNRGE